MQRLSVSLDRHRMMANEARQSRSFSLAAARRDCVASAEMTVWRQFADCYCGRGGMSLITASWGRFAAPERRTMGVACGAHVLHDGYTDLLYVLLPIWQAQVGLGYAEGGLFRALFVGAVAGVS